MEIEAFFVIYPPLICLLCIGLLMIAKILPATLEATDYE